MGFFTRQRSSPDIQHWNPEILHQSVHYAIIRMPDGFVSTPVCVLQLFERLHSLGFEVLEVSYTDRLIARKAASCHTIDRLAHDLLDPEMYGYAVSPEIRDRARRVLGLPAVESMKKGDHAA